VRVWEPRFLVGVVGIASAEDGRLLCVRHVFRPKAYPWGLPSGFVRRAEAPAEAIVREIREETGFEAQVEKLLEAALVRPGQIELLMRLRLGMRRETGSFEAVEAGLFPAEALPSGFLPSNLAALRRHGHPQAAEAGTRP
jgi:8-oxo-dGTP pyrophosphatase MutT (NUDIX family)